MNSSLYFLLSVRLYGRSGPLEPAGPWSLFGPPRLRGQGFAWIQSRPVVGPHGSPCTGGSGLLGPVPSTRSRLPWPLSLPWVPTSAGMTVEWRVPACLGLSLPWVPASAGMTVEWRVPVPAFAGMTFFSGNDGEGVGPAPMVIGVAGFWLGEPFGGGGATWVPMYRLEVDGLLADTCLSVKGRGLPAPGGSPFHMGGAS